MTHIYILTDPERLKVNKYKIGSTRSDQKGLISQYTRGCPEVRLLFYERFENAKTLETQIKKKFTLKRVANINGNSSEWYDHDINEIIGFILREGVREKNIHESNNLENEMLQIEIERVKLQLEIKTQQLRRMQIAVQNLSNEFPIDKQQSIEITCKPHCELLSSISTSLTTQILANESHTIPNSSKTLTITNSPFIQTPFCAPKIITINPTLIPPVSSTPRTLSLVPTVPLTPRVESLMPTVPLIPMVPLTPRAASLIPMISSTPKVESLIPTVPLTPRVESLMPTVLLTPRAASLIPTVPLTPRATSLIPTVPSTPRVALLIPTVPLTPRASSLTPIVPLTAMVPSTPRAVSLIPTVASTPRTLSITSKV